MKRDHSYSATVRCNRVTVVDTGSLDVAKHHFGIEDSVKDVSISRILKEMYETDFNESKSAVFRKALSQENKKFLEIMDTGCTKSMDIISYLFLFVIQTSKLPTTNYKRSKG